MRSTIDLIEELQSEAEGAVTAALIVGFESTTLFLEAGEKNALMTLNEMIRSGGEPVGIMRAIRDGLGTAVTFRPLPEYSEDEHIQGFLRKLSETCVRHYRPRHNNQ